MFWKLILIYYTYISSGFVVEKRDVTHAGGWVPAVTWIDPNQTHCTVPRLMEGNQYEFRVMAENLQGIGDPLVSDKPITAKESAGKLLWLKVL